MTGSRPAAARFVRWQELEYEKLTSYPGKGKMLIYPGGISEMEMIPAYGCVHFASKVGQLAVFRL